VKKKIMSGRNIAKEMEMIDALLGNEMKQTDAMYESYPDGYNQRLADTNNRLYGSFVRLQFKGDVSSETGRILIESGLAKTVSRAYYCARAELSRRPGSPVFFFEPERPCGPPVDVKAAYISVRWMMGMGRWRRQFERMDPALAGNEDLNEIMKNHRTGWK